jgi:hypothetical protein
MALGIGGIGSFRWEDPYDPRRSLGAVPSQLNIPGLPPVVEGIQGDLDRVQRYFARQATRAPQPLNPQVLTDALREQATRPQGQLSLNVSLANTPGTYVGKDGNVYEVGRNEQMPAGGTAEAQIQRRGIETLPSGTEVGGAYYLDRDPRVKTRRDGGQYRPDSRLQRRDAIVSEGKSFAALNTPERVEQMLAAKAGRRPLSEAEQAFMAVQEMRRTTESGEERLFLDEYATELAEMVRVEGYSRDESGRNVDVSGYSAEDPAQFEAKRSGKNLKTITQQPDYRTREPVTYIEDAGGAGVPEYLVEALQRQPGGQWEKGGKMAYGTVDPNKLVAVPPGYEREGDVDEDQTASFLREKEIRLKDAVNRLNEGGKTPVMGRSALKQAQEEGRFRPLSQAEYTARQVAARAQGKQDTLIGYLTRSTVDRTKEGVKYGEEILPVYRPKGVTGTRQVPESGNELNGVSEESEQLFRVGSPVNRSYEEVRDFVRQAQEGGSSRTQKGVRGDITLAPLIGDAGIRGTMERKYDAVSQADFFRQLGDLSARIPVETQDALRDVLAKAAMTGEMPVVQGKSVVRRPMHGTVESLYSNINPRRSGDLNAPDSRAAAAGKQLRAFLQEAPRPLTQAEAVDAAAQFGARFGVDANAALQAAAEMTTVEVPLPGDSGKTIARKVPVNDPGRALFAPGSYAAAMLEQAKRERVGGRRIDLFPEPATEGPVETGTPRFETDEASQLLELLQSSGMDEADYVNRLDRAEVIRSRSGYQLATAEPERVIDPVGSYVDYATRYTGGDRDQAAFVVQEMLRDEARSMPMGAMTLPRDSSRLDLLQKIDAIGAPSVDVVQAGTGNYDPVAADRIRMAYRPSPEGTAPVAGIPAGATFNDMASALGGEVGSESQERAMALLASRIAQRSKTAQDSTLNAPTPGQYPSEPVNRGNAMARRRLLGVLGR